MNFTEKDIQQIENQDLTLNDVKSQITLFKNGMNYVDLVSAAGVDNAIWRLNEDEVEHFSEFYSANSKNLEVIKFVPASGAATRMFKFLYKFLSDYNPEEQSVNSFINKHKQKDLSVFLVGLEKFPFYHIVKHKLAEDSVDFESLDDNEQAVLFVKMMLDEDQLDYGNYPKGLLPFHLYKNLTEATAFEEHLFETVLYAPTDKEVHIHFTISEAHEHKFKNEFNRIKEKVETTTNAKFKITFSYQKSSTNTIAVNLKNEPFRNTDGSLLFRPGGHGALIDNLNDLDADVIFIKNIDNVVTYKYKHQVALYKKVLAGILLELQGQIFDYQRLLEQPHLNENQLNAIAEFLQNKLNVHISSEFEKYSENYKIEYLQQQINKPIRICGMVKNEGEPGGGPFWVKDDNGKISLQIVESAQMDKDNKQQQAIADQASHFNPVDLVCGVKNYKGEKYDLKKFIDHNAAFITKKTQEGQELKALEKPGLWNGGMAFWNTVFVEVPLITFNPVKTVNDLLKPAHQVRKMD
ncbi:DUF4301 family protein [Paucihalobacter ruber]|uniref:DUF4301 family protein n=1 Tax=Paucihalobacter ruber TaxID=2567861 RepID=A0A506PL86_9FLAO|nr:DUF4301 family protein [Paucihalobacter ruber]TPV34656.1 DUF4301 family protein [Paucihalobacter ruber]